MKNRLTQVLGIAALALIGTLSVTGIEIANANCRSNCRTNRFRKNSVIPNQSQVNQFEMEVFKLTNQIRQRYGLNPLKGNWELIRAAKYHSTDMARNQKVSHTGSDGSTALDRTRRFGYSSSFVAENVACGQRSAQQVVNSWMNSPPHRKNILNSNYTEIGIGYVPSNSRCRTYWTQLFGRR